MARKAIAKVCRSKSKTSAKKAPSTRTTSTHNITSSPSNSPVSTYPSSSDPSSESVYTLFSVSSRGKPIMLPVQIQGKTLHMELDTGGVVVVSE